jgi:hypothetical protein
MERSFSRDAQRAAIDLQVFNRTATLGATGCLSASECAFELGDAKHWLTSSQWHSRRSFDYLNINKR